MEGTCAASTEACHPAGLVVYMARFFGIEHTCLRSSAQAIHGWQHMANNVASGKMSSASVGPRRRWCTYLSTAHGLAQYVKHCGKRLKEP